MAVIVLTSQERVGNIYTSFSSHEHNENTSLPNEITGPKVGRCQEEEKLWLIQMQKRKKRSETRKKKPTGTIQKIRGGKKRLLLQRNAKLVTVSSLLKCSFASWNNSHGFSSKEKKKKEKRRRAQKQKQLRRSYYKGGIKGISVFMQYGCKVEHFKRPAKSCYRSSTQIITKQSNPYI